MGMTVAGTAQDSHLIPFSCTGETPIHHHFGCKDTHYFIYMQFFLEKIAYSSRIAGCLFVLQQFILIVSEGIGMLVERLLVEQLGFEQVAHL